MKTIPHRVILDSKEHFGRKLPPHDVGVFLAELPTAIRYAISMAVRNSSAQSGKRPRWLDRAADIRFVDFCGNGRTTLYFEAPTLGEAAEEIYTQSELWPPRPDASDTGFELLSDVLHDVERHNSDSEKFDIPLLKRLVRFRHCFGGNLTQARIENLRTNIAEFGVLSMNVVHLAKPLCEDTPPSRRVRLVGILDSVRASSRTFDIRLPGGEEVRGTLLEGSIEELARLFNREILVDGTAVFRASGKLLRVDVDTYRPATDADRFFEKLPKPMKQNYRFTSQDRLKMVEGLRSTFGKWPGDESDADFEEALKELS